MAKSKSKVQKNEPVHLMEHKAIPILEEKVSKSDIQWAPINRICFRGDDRNPKDIFESGFIPLENGEEVVKSAFESNADNVIAFSSRFKSALLFPLNKDKKNTWVYVFKARHGFDVHQHGYAAHMKEGLDEEHANLLFVDEIVTDQVPACDIIAAVSIARYPYDRFLDKVPAYLNKNPSLRNVDDETFIEFYHKRGKYITVTYEMNPHCTLPESEKKLAEWFIKKEMEANKSHDVSATQLPMPTSGYHRNRVFTSGTVVNAAQNSGLSGTRDARQITRFTK